MTLSKQAYSLAAIAKQIKSAKKAGKIINSRNIDMKIDDAGEKYIMSTTKGIGMGPFTLPRKLERVPKAVSDYFHKNNMAKGIYSKGNAHAKLTQAIHENNEVLKKYPGILETVNPNRKGTASIEGRHLGVGSSKSLNPEDKKAVNMITHKHELDELRAAKDLNRHTKGIHGSANRAYQWGGTSHLSPSVVLREGNAIRTLGKDTGGKEIYHKAKALFHVARTETGQESNHLKYFFDNHKAKHADNLVFTAKNKMKTPDSNKFDYEYGKTRLSRHAIKRIEQAHLKHGYIGVRSD